MRRFAAAVALPLLLLACASQPPQKLSGRYAVVVDPALAPQETVQVSPLLHQRVQLALQHRLELAPTVAEAETVILLEPSDKPGTVRYQIRRGDSVVTSYAQIGPIAKSQELSFAEQRAPRHQEGLPTSDIVQRRSGPKMDQDLQRALGPVAARIVNQIVHDLQQPRKLTGKYAIDADPALRSGRAAYDVGHIYQPLVAALGQRIHLIESFEDADAVIVLRPGPAHGTLAYDIVRGKDLALSRVTASQTLVRQEDLETLGERLDRQRWNEYAAGNHTIVIRRDANPKAIPNAELEQERVTRPLSVANRIADQIVRELSKL